MPPTDSTFSPSYWVNFFPNPVTRVIVLVGSILVPLFCFVRWALPSRRIRSMDKAFHDLKKLYDALDGHLLNFQLESDFTISEEFLALDNQARRLRIETLNLSMWWNELGAIFNGHSLAIVKCTRQLGALKRNIQLLYEKRTHDMNMASTAGLSPAQQLRLRRQRTLGSET
ncbi:hypothetical protein C8R45DRAFT_1099809 [Mycena sanguinolenta]|nr:hypothetical protein C8R45DRAFT_1099809 [Mycena sanguinolenta]